MECEEDTVEIEEMIGNINQMMQNLEERNVGLKVTLHSSNQQQKIKELLQLNKSLYQKCHELLLEKAKLADEKDKAEEAKRSFEETINELLQSKAKLEKELQVLKSSTNSTFATTTEVAPSNLNLNQ